MTPAPRRLILCGGLQSSGSSLVSWCFLQRGDTNGVLDAAGDELPRVPQVAEPVLWIKTTVSSFRLSELARHLADEGHDVRRLLVMRDPRDCWASLQGKPYGRNGTTAEDPPLRMRFARFVEDWRQARDAGDPILLYERFVSEPRPTMSAACDALDLPWDDAMLEWPKPIEAIADVRHGNKAFRATRGAGGLAAALQAQPKRPPGGIAGPDLDWLDAACAELCAACGYPARRDDIERLDAPAAAPDFAVTRRFRWKLHQKPLRLLLHRLGVHRS